jgi:hypothetical protein
MPKKDADNPPTEVMPTARAIQQSGIIRANINREVEPSAEFASIYANDAQLQVTAWDIRLIFGVISNIPTPEAPTVLVRQVGEVRLSLPLAKRLAMILTAQIERYEQNIGPIAIPKD